MKKKRLVFLCAVLSLCILFTSCGDKNSQSLENNGNSEANNDSVIVWSHGSADKILKDMDYEIDISAKAQYNLLVAKGEYEASQIIITSTVGGKEYDIKLNDLHSTTGEIFSKDNIDVYNEKYIDIIASSKNNEFDLGLYPDALLPFDVAKKYKENVTSKGNQGIYIESYIPNNQKAGLYKGSFTLTVGNVDYDIPASINVLDYEISRDSTFQSDYVIQDFYMASGELTTSVDLYDKYVDSLLSFRVSPHFLTHKGFDEYIQKIRKNANPALCQNRVIMSTINIPTNLYGNDFNKEEWDSYIKEIVKISLQDNYNYVAKCAVYCGFIDEPALNGTYSLANSVSRSFNEHKQYLHDNFESVFADLLSLNDDASFVNEVKKSILDINNYVTASIDKERLPDVTNHCVHVNGSISSDIKAQNYKDNGYKHWIYTCSGSNPGFHIDIPLTYQRGLSWSAFDYGFKGDLIWETALYSYSDGVNKNPYKIPVRVGGINGDGMMFYPGKYYGIDGPVASIRLHAVRDGKEEYEYMNDLCNLYTKAGYNGREILSEITQQLYKNKEFVSSGDTLLRARKNILQLVMLAKNGVFVTDTNRIGTDFIVDIAYSGDNRIEKTNGVLDNNKITLSLLNNTNELFFKTTSGHEFNLYLSGKAEIISNFTDSSKIILSDGAKSKNEIIDGVNTTAIEWSAPQTSVKFNISGKDYNKSLDILSFDVYSSQDNGCLVLKLNGSAGVTILQEYVLHKGWNNLKVLQVYNTKFRLVKKIDNLEFEFFSFQNGNNKVALSNLVKVAK